jgi:Tfp pilus assembly protein PilX
MPMHDDRSTRFARDERGMALFIALICLVVLSLAAAAFMSVGNVETKVAGHNLRGSQALNLAEAGVAEALSRLRRGDIPNNLKPGMVTQIFLAAPGSVPVLTGDSIALSTAQEAGQWLQYSTPNITDKVLTVEYKTDANKTVIYKYDSTKNPAIQTTSGMPIFEITSTGRKGTDRRQVVTEVVQKPVSVNAMGALVADVAIEFSGTSNVCGFNHRMDMSPWSTPCSSFHNGPPNKPGAWSSGEIKEAGATTVIGSPDTASHQTGFYQGPWSVFSMSQQEFFTWLGSPTAIQPEPPVGIVYLDNNDVAQDLSGDFNYNGGEGEGFLYVDGNLTVNGNFIYRGLIYIEKDLQINGTCWVLGGIVVKGQTTIKIANGTATVLYSQDAIVENVTKYGGQYVTLSWIEN